MKDDLLLRRSLAFLVLLFAHFPGAGGPCAGGGCHRSSSFGAAAYAQADSTPPAPVLSPPPELADSLWKVDTILLFGNRQTKDYVILREMTLRPGMAITRELLEYDQNRIYSLRLFNRVELHVVPSPAAGPVGGGARLANLIVEVSERWYLFPFPIFGIRDRDWSKLYYGAGILHQNFRGRNEKVYAALALGYDPSLSLSYRNPFLNQGGTDFLEAGIGYSTVKNRSLLAQQAGTENFDEKHVGAELRLGKRYGIAHALAVRFGYAYVGVAEPLPGRTISLSGIDRYPTAGVSYSYDTRNLAEYPSQGVLVSASVMKYGFPSSTGVDYVRYALDLRNFMPLVFPGLTLAGRAFGDVARAGPTPSYDRRYFGYGERIRGHFRDVYEGENILGATAELRCVLFSPVYYSVGLLPSEFSLWRFGVVAALFADAGTVWFRGTPVALDRVVKGYGAGLDFLLPYSIILRVEYALNEARRGQFIIDVGSVL